MSGVDFYQQQGLAIITLDDPQHDNTLTEDLLGRLSDCLDVLDQHCRVLLIRSSSAVFSYGMRLERMSTGDPGAGSRLFANLLSRIHRLPQFTIAALQGPCKAGGLGLPLACDLICCSAAASFQLSEVLFGLLPVNLSPYLLQRVNSRKLLQLAATAEELPAAAAVDIGLVDLLATDDAKLEKKLRRLLRQLFRCSPRAVTRMKVFRDRLLESNFSQGTQIAEQLLVQLLSDGENRQAVAGFCDGVLPAWSESFKADVPLVLTVDNRDSCA